MKRKRLDLAAKPFAPKKETTVTEIDSETKGSINLQKLEVTNEPRNTPTKVKPRQAITNKEQASIKGTMLKEKHLSKSEQNRNQNRHSAS